MKKYLLILVALFAISMTASAQDYTFDKSRNRFVKKTLSVGESKSNSSLKISNASTTVWVDGFYKKVSYGGKEIGTVCEGVDKHGNLWVANLTERRLKVTYYYYSSANTTQLSSVTEIMDPFEVSILRDKNTKAQLTNSKKPPYNLNIGSVSDYK